LKQQRKLKLRIQNLSVTIKAANVTLKKVYNELESSMTKGINHLNCVNIQGKQPDLENITLEQLSLPNLQHFMFEMQ
jgi:hypothetical protein